MKNINNLKDFLTENKDLNINSEGVKDLLTLLGYDVMYHEEHKEYFFEALIDNKIKTIWIDDFLEPKYTIGKYNL